MATKKPATKLVKKQPREKHLCAICGIETVKNEDDVCDECKSAQDEDLLPPDSLDDFDDDY